MKNFGLQRLTLVDSRIGSWTDAHQMAVHAGDVLAGARKVEHLDEATAEAQWIIGTSNQAPAGTRVLSPREVALESKQRGLPPTILFGGEIHGLEPGEMLRCHAVSTVPTRPEQSSLNLAQAVGIYAAELYATLQDARSANASAAEAAPAELLQHLERLLRDLLEGSRWASKSRPKNAIAQLMQPLYRANMSETEIRAWLVALGKAAQRTD